MKITIYSCVVVVLILSTLQTATDKKYDSEGWKLFELQRMQINNVDIPVTNYGEFGMSEAHTAGTYWPKGSGQSFIFGSGLWIGALVNGDTLVSVGYNTVGRGCDFCPGPPEHGQDHYQNSQSHPEDRLYFSTDTVDFAEWPLRDSLGNAISAVFRTPDLWADQEVWCEYHDSVPEFHEWEPGTYPLGIVVKQVSFAWNSPIHENMIFFLYEFENVSDDTIKNMYVGHTADDDVGWADDDLLGCDIERSLGWTCTLVKEEGWDSDPPYYVGKRFLQGPKADDTVYVAAGPTDPNYPDAIADTVYPGEHIPLTSFTRCTRGYDADTEWKRYSMLAGYNIETREYDPWQGVIDIIPDDKRMVMGCGPFELAPGEVDTFFIAVIFSNGDVGGLDYLKEEADIAKRVAGILNYPPKIRIVYPNGGEDLSGVQIITWESEKVDSVDLYLSPDSGRTWNTLVAGLENTESYHWNTEATPDGFYFLKACTHDSCLPICDRSDGEFLVNNPGNGSPQTRVLAPNGGESLSGLIEVNWWARDPDEDTISINLYYSNDNGSSFLPIAIGLPNSGSHFFNTGSFPNGTECLIKVEATDGALSSWDCSDAVFSVFNSYEPWGEVEHVAGGCNTVRMTAEIVREWELLPCTYEVRFGAPRFDSHMNAVVYTYYVYNLTSGTTVVEDHEYLVNLDGTPTIYYSPLFDGISLKIEAAVDSTTFNPDSIRVAIGEYTDGLQIAEFFTPQGAELNYTTPECKIWAFRGEGTIKMEWSKIGDTLRAKVFDLINDIEIPLDTTIGNGWCFGPFLPFEAPRSFLTQSRPAVWFYISGVRYYFNGGNQMSEAGFASIDSGDVWLLYNSGDRPPLLGDIYRFSPLGIVELSDPRPGIFLFPNFPNPFSYSTTITYYIPSQMEVSLIIYDIVGRRVKKLAHRIEKAGVHTVRWNGDDDSGERVSQGVYFCRLSVHPCGSAKNRGLGGQEYTATRKLLVMR